jgi:hypothetical protein
VQACSARQKQALATRGAGSSFWPTPTASLNGNKVDLRIDGPRAVKTLVAQTSKGKQVGIMQAAQSWAVLYLMIQALGLKAGGRANFPYSHPLHVTLWPGTRHSAGSLSLNPRFLDWLMGWPPGWTDPMQPVTGWSLWLQRSRTELSRLQEGFEAGLKEVESGKCAAK